MLTVSKFPNVRILKANGRRRLGVGLNIPEVYKQVIDVYLSILLSE